MDTNLQETMVIIIYVGSILLFTVYSVKKIFINKNFNFQNQLVEEIRSLKEELECLRSMFK